MSNELNIDAIWVFSALDKLMSDHKSQPAIFCKLFEKKKLMINVLQEKKIDAKKYKMIVGKALKEQNQVVRACASNDALKLKDSKDEEMTNLWFREMIDATGISYENQEKLYQKYQIPSVPQQPQPPQQQEVKQPEVLQTRVIKVQQKKQTLPQTHQASSIIGGINVDQIVSFKVVDSLLEQNEQKKQFYEKFLQRKKKLLELVSSKALTGDKYKSTLSTYQSKITNSNLQQDMKFELDGLEDFHDGNVQKWFTEIIQETKDSLKEQEQHLTDLSKGKSIKKQSKEITLEVEAEISKVRESTPIDFKEVMTFKVIEDQLQLEDGNKSNFKLLLDKKKNLLDLYKKGALTAEKYKALIVKAISQVKNSEIKESMEMELADIDDVDDGDIQKWFKDAISSAELFLEDQEKKLVQLEKGGAPSKGKDDELNMMNDELDESDQEKPVKKPAASKANVEKKNQSTGNKVLLDFKQLYSLKAIDEYLEEYAKNPQIFCLCFERKLQIFEMMKKGELTPEKYRDLQIKTFSTTKNEKLKDIIEMDLDDLKEISHNDVNEWFESLVNDSGFDYEDQEVLYNKFSKKSPKKEQSAIQQASNIQKSDKQQSSMIKIAQKPVINDVICFTAIFKLFIYAVERVDIIYYKELEIKRGKLIDLITQNKLVPGKYRDINKAAASKTTNVFLKNTILEEENRLKSEFKGDEQSWFESLTNVLKSPPPELKLPQNKEMKRINSSSAQKKTEFFLRSMATYECLFYFYKKNKIPIEQNKYLNTYEKKTRKEVVHCLELIQKDPTFDVYNLSLQMFPEINNDIFYGDNLAGLKKRAEYYPPLIAKEIAALKDYASKIKKSSNTQNIENAKKEIAKCEENLSFLKSWPSGAMIPFPSITQQKVQKFNLDLNSKLQKNEIQVSITNLGGLQGQTIMNIYLVNFNQQRYSNRVNNGPTNARFVAKLNEKEMFEVCKGDKKHLLLRFFKKGFFGGLSLISQGQIQTIFSRTNIIEQKIMIGSIQVSYVLKVNKPMRPLITEIAHIEVVQHPKYKHDSFVEQELIKKYIMYSSPTPSEIIQVQP